MKKYSVETTPSAEADIIDSFIWGCGEWGVENATDLVNKLRERMLKNLSTFPFKYAVAPERGGYDVELRQMIVGRYRVIFYVDNSVVRVVHVTGSFVEGSEIDDTDG